MKNLLQNILRALIIIYAILITFIFFKVEKNWLIPLLFSYNLVLIGIFVLFGDIFTLFSIFLILIVNIIGYIRTLALHLSLFPFFIETLITICVFFLIKKVNQINTYYIFQTQDTLKILDGEYSTLLIRQKELQAAIEADKEKLEKYKKLYEINENMKKLSSFSEKVRYILRNIIFVFHKEKKISLFLLKEGRFLKVEADRDEDVFYAEKDQENLELRNFDEWIVSNRKSLIVSDMHKEIRFKAEGNEKIRSLIGVPIIVNNTALGLIRITSDNPGSFNQEDLRFLDLIAGMFAKILEEEKYA